MNVARVSHESSDYLTEGCHWKILSSSTLAGSRTVQSLQYLLLSDRELCPAAGCLSGPAVHVPHRGRYNREALLYDCLKLLPPPAPGTPLAVNNRRRFARSIESSPALPLSNH